MHIAYIEDETRLAESLAEGLRDEGNQVALYPDAETFEQDIVGGHIPFDLLIVDLMLPGKSGYDLTHGLRKQGSNVPVLMLTARGSTRDKVEGFDVGADDYLVKPFDFEELLARARALSRRAVSTKDDLIHIGDLEIDMRARKAYRANIEISLTKTEFDMLRLLAAEPGKAWSREEISRALWREGEDGGSNVLDVHIWNLRNKLDGDYEKKYLRTVRGVGYAIEA